MDTGQLHRQSGFSIVELMVAVVIGLIGILVIFQVFAVSEGYRRTNNAGSDAQQAGALAVYVLEHELRQAGWGFNNKDAIGCNVSSYDKSRGDLPSYTLVPVRITPAATATGSDTIEVMYGNGGATLAPILLSQNMASATDDYVVANRYGFAQGDVFLVAESGQCTLAQVTCLPGANNSCPNDSPTLNRNIQHDANSGLNRYNKPGGFGIANTVAAKIFNLGAGPVRNIYTVDATTNQLVMTPFITSNQSQPVADNIVQMKAQFGMDDGIAGLGNPVAQADDGSIDEYINSPQPTTATQIKRLLSVRVGVVSRSATPEKPSDKSKTCDTTTTAPVWSGGTFNLSANPNWQCYRYKVFESTIPIRNMVWNQD